MGLIVDKMKKGQPRMAALFLYEILLGLWDLFVLASIVINNTSV